MATGLASSSVVELLGRTSVEAGHSERTAMERAGERRASGSLAMALGVAVVQHRFENPREILGDRLQHGSIYRLLADHGDVLFPDDDFADLHMASVRGRSTVPARVLATVMVPGRPNYASVTEMVETQPTP